MKLKRISFLFGAGISIPAGLPSTGKLTEEVLCKWDEWFKNSSHYDLKLDSGQSIEYFSNNQFNHSSGQNYQFSIINYHFILS